MVLVIIIRNPPNSIGSYDKEPPTRPPPPKKKGYLIEGTPQDSLGNYYRDPPK